MKEDAQVCVVTDPEAANLLTDPAQLELLEPFFRGDVVLGELAKELGVKLNTLLYRVNKLVDLGLVEVVREEPRRGKPVKIYRAAAGAFFVPFESTTSVSLGGLLGSMTEEGERLFYRELARGLQTFAPSWGLRVVLNNQKQLAIVMSTSQGGYTEEFTDAFFGPAAPALYLGDGALTLDFATAKRMQRELFELFRRYTNEQKAGGQRYAYRLGLTPVVDDSREKD